MTGLFLQYTNILIMALFFIIIIFIFYIFSKLKTISQLKEKIDDLNKTIENLDAQAKIIIKSDLDAKLYQEEAEDKLKKLILLKNLIVSLIGVLDKEKIFLQLNKKIINEIGFEKALILDFEDFNVKLNYGFEKEFIEEVKNIINIHKNLLKRQLLIPEGSKIYEQIYNRFNLNFIIGIIRGRENIYGVFLLSDPNREITFAEKEILTIIFMYLGQCLDAIKLFEETYKTKEALEVKINERTQELIKSLKEIERISKAKSDFISTLSHELRTPLTSIKGFSSLLIEDKFGKLPPEAKNRLEKIDENIDKLVDMVNTLLDISRIESKKTEIKIAPSDIISLINEVVDFLSPQLEAKNIKCNLELPSQLIVHMDRGLIERVMLNLLNNAIKFTPENGKIEIKIKIENKSAIIIISDTGCGIPKEDIDKIFDEFFRVNNPINMQTKGSGLGLSLVKKIIESHKEKIWVESEIGKGTNFYFTLRIKEENV